MTLQFILFVYLGFACYVILPAVFNFYLGTRTRRWSRGCINWAFYILMAYFATALIVLGLNRFFVPGLTAEQKQFFRYYFFISPIVFLLIGYSNYLRRLVGSVQYRLQLRKIRRSNDQRYLLKQLTNFNQAAADRLIELDLQNSIKNSIPKKIFGGELKVGHSVFRSLLETVVKHKTDMYNDLIITTALEVLDKEQNQAMAESLAYFYVFGNLSQDDIARIDAIKEKNLFVEAEELGEPVERTYQVMERTERGHELVEKTKTIQPRKIYHWRSLETLINRIRE